MLQKTIHRKQTDRQIYLDAKSKNPKLLKDSIPYSQALHINQICSYSKNFYVTQRKWLINFKSQKQGNNRSLNEQHIDKANLQEREQLLKEKTERHYFNYPFITNITEHSLK